MMVREAARRSGRTDLTVEEAVILANNTAQSRRTPACVIDPFGQLVYRVG